MLIKREGLQQVVKKPSLCSGDAISYHLIRLQSFALPKWSNVLYLPVMFSSFANYLQSKIAIDDAQLHSVRQMVTEMRARKGDILLQANDICPYISFVVKGCLRSFVVDAKGRAHVIQFAPENWWISEQISLLNQEPSMFNIDAVEDTEYLALPGNIFEELGQLVPGSLAFTNRLQLNSLRSLQKRLVSHLSETGEQRYTMFVKTYPQLALRLPQKMIASYLGITPESLSRIRKFLIPNS